MKNLIAKKILSLLIPATILTSSVSGILAAELIATEIVGDTPNQIIQVVAGGDAVNFSLETKSDQNLPTSVSFNVDTAYHVDSTAASSSTASDSVILTSSEPKKTVQAQASAASDAVPGDYPIRIRFSNISGDGNSAPKDNKADYLVVRVVAPAAPVNPDPTPVTPEAPKDLIAPVVTAAADHEANSYGWYNSDVTVNFSATDEGGSGLASVSGPVTLSNEGKDQVANGNAKDNAGNEGSASLSVSIDKTKPVVQASADRAPNAHGWYNANVTVGFQASDNNGSGIASVDASVTLVNEGSNQVISGSAKDLADNVSSDAITLNLDKTAPSISAVYSDKVVLNSKPVLTWTAADSLSGLESPASGVVNLDTSSVGPKTVTLYAKDLAGNEIVRTISYKVVYAFGGVLQPINADGSSVYKLGSTAPAKFQLKDANGTLVSSAIAKLNYAKVDSTVTTAVNEVISTAASTTDNLFRYDATANQYIYNLSTKNLSEGKYKLNVTLDDGETYSVQIGIRK